MTRVNNRVPFLALAAVVSLLTAGQVSAGHPFSEDPNLFSLDDGLFATQANQSQFSATTAITLNADEFYGVEFDTGPKLFGGIEEGLFGDLYGVEGSLDLAWQDRATDPIQSQLRECRSKIAVHGFALSQQCSQWVINGRKCHYNLIPGLYRESERLLQVGVSGNHIRR